MIDGRYVSNDKNRFRRNTFGEQRKNTDVSSPEPKRTERTPPPAKEEEKDSPRPRSSIRCYRCKEPGHLSYNCPTKPTSTKPPGPRAGYLCLTPLNTEPHFTEYYIEGFIGGKQAKMLVDTGCTRTLVHRKFVSKSDETANKITVLTATGERIVIPLAWVEIKVQQGTYKELVGVIENLPVDCLLGRSSYGRVITRQNLLNQWGDCDQAFVVTRNQIRMRLHEGTCVGHRYRKSRFLQHLHVGQPLTDRCNSSGIKVVSHMLLQHGPFIDRSAEDFQQMCLGTCRFRAGHC